MVRTAFSGGRVLIMCAAFAGALASCATTPQSMDNTRLQDKEWVAVRLGGKDMNKQPEVTLNFKTDGSVSGVSGCNRYSGPATFNRNVVSFGPAAVTAMACSDPRANGVERVYFENLKKVRMWEIAEEQLRLQNGEGVTLIRFKTRQQLAAGG